MQEFKLSRVIRIILAIDPPLDRKDQIDVIKFLIYQTSSPKPKSVQFTVI